MNTITIIGLGAGDLDQLALGTYQKAEGSGIRHCEDGPASGHCGIKGGRHGN